MRRKRPWKEKRNRHRRKRDNGVDEHFYSKIDWREYSIEYRSKDEHKHCVRCSERGVKTKAEVVDHVIPMRHVGAIWDDLNHEPLCITCHNTKSPQEKIKPLYAWMLNEEGYKIPHRDNRGKLIRHRGGNE